jgi:hypothetical protein
MVYARRLGGKQYIGGNKMAAVVCVEMGSLSEIF